MLSYKGPISQHVNTTFGVRNLRNTAFVEGRVVLAKTIFPRIWQIDLSEIRSRTGCYGPGEILYSKMSDFVRIRK